MRISKKKIFFCESLTYLLCLGALRSFRHIEELLLVEKFTLYHMEEERAAVRRLLQREVVDDRRLAEHLKAATLNGGGGAVCHRRWRRRLRRNRVAIDGMTFWHAHAVKISSQRRQHFVARGRIDELIGCAVHPAVEVRMRCVAAPRHQRVDAMGEYLRCVRLSAMIVDVVGRCCSFAAAAAAAAFGAL